MSSSGDISQFIHAHPWLCGLTLGLAIPVYCIGHWLGRAMTWIKQPKDQTAKVERVARTNLSEKTPVVSTLSLPTTAASPIPLKKTPNTAFKPTIPTDYLGEIRQLITNLKKGKITSARKASRLPSAQKKKVLIYDTLLRNCNKLKEHRVEFLTDRPTTGMWKPVKIDIAKGIMPSYFDEKVTLDTSRETQVGFEKGFFDYEGGPHTFTMDFSNRFFGGGALEEGWIQEEQMLAEFPEVLGFMAANLRNEDPLTRCQVLTREGGDSPGKGTPTPFAIKNAQRVQKVGGPLDNPTFQPLTEPKYCNILVAAAPRVYESDDAWSETTLADIFHTLVLSCNAAKRALPAGETPHIQSGRFGCGFFANDQRAVFFLHCLVSEMTGIPFDLFAYKQADFNSYMQEWNQLKTRMITTHPKGTHIQTWIREISQLK